MARGSCPDVQGVHVILRLPIPGLCFCILLQHVQQAARRAADGGSRRRCRLLRHAVDTPPYGEAHPAILLRRIRQPRLQVELQAHLAHASFFSTCMKTSVGQQQDCEARTFAPTSDGASPPRRHRWKVAQRVGKREVRRGECCRTRAGGVAWFCVVVLPTREHPLPSRFVRSPQPRPPSHGGACIDARTQVGRVGRPLGSAHRRTSRERRRRVTPDLEADAVVDPLPSCS